MYRLAGLNLIVAWVWFLYLLWFWQGSLLDVFGIIVVLVNVHEFIRQVRC